MTRLSVVRVVASSWSWRRELRSQMGTLGCRSLEHLRLDPSPGNRHLAHSAAEVSSLRRDEGGRVKVYKRKRHGQVGTVSQLCHNHKTCGQTGSHIAEILGYDTYLCQKCAKTWKQAYESAVGR